MTNEEKMLDILASMSLRFDSMDARFDSMDARFDSMDARFDSMDARFDSMDVRMDSMDVRMDAMDTRMDSMENAILKINIKLETDIEAKLVSLADGHTTITEQLTPRSRIDDMETEIRFLKTVMFKMNDELQQLKQAQ